MEVVPDKRQLYEQKLSTLKTNHKIVLEAMQQNNIRPFENAREEMVFEDFLVPPAAVKKKKKKKKRKTAAVVDEETTASSEPEWKKFDSMKDAIQVGRWSPGTSFSFIARNVRGQQVKSEADVKGSEPVGGSWQV